MCIKFFSHIGKEEGESLKTLIGRVGWGIKDFSQIAFGGKEKVKMTEIFNLFSEIFKRNSEKFNETNFSVK